MLGLTVLIMLAGNPLVSPENVAWSCEHQYPHLHDEWAAAGRAFEPDEVRITAEWRGGWGGASRLTVDATGEGVVTATEDSRTAGAATYTVVNAPTLSWANKLLETGFLALPDSFDSSSDVLVQCPTGRLYRIGSAWDDTGEARLTLELGDQVHTVHLVPPAPRAPAQVRSVLEEMQALREAIVGGGD